MAFVLLLQCLLVASLVGEGPAPASAAGVGPSADAAPGPRDAGLLLQVWGDQPGDRFGCAVASVGDVDGDGRSDLLVGASRRDGVAPGAGRAELLSGADGHPLLVLDGDEAYGFLGSSVDGAGDLDGDGVPDLLLGAPAAASGRGRVVVASGADGSPLFLLDGVAAGDRFGHALAGVGDVDLDGVPDLLVGAPHADGGGANAGRASLHSGVDGARLAAWDGATFDLLGLSVARAGDLDGDGRADVLVGAPFTDVAAFNGGSLLVLPGTGGAALAVHHGSGVGDQLGTWVASVGDVDADGVPDVAAGAPGDDGAFLDGGSVVLCSGATGDVLRTLFGTAVGEGLGAVAGAGDLDGDGHADVVLGASAASGSGVEAGQVRLVSGATGTMLCVSDGERAFGWLGAAVAGVGDLDGDGRPDVAAGAPVHDDVLSLTGRLGVIGCAPFAPGSVHEPPLKH